MPDSELLALFPLEVVLFPGAPLPLHIFEPRYLELVGDCLHRQRPFGVLLETGGERAEVGCTAEIRSVLTRHEDGRLDILTEGVRRFRVREIDDTRPVLRARVDWLDEEPAAIDVERARVLELYRRTFWAHATGIAPSQVEEAEWPSYLVARSALLAAPDRQRLLEIASERERLEALAEALASLEPAVSRLNGNGHLGRPSEL